MKKFKRRQGKEKNIQEKREKSILEFHKPPILLFYFVPIDHKCHDLYLLVDLELPDRSTYYIKFG